MLDFPGLLFGDTDTKDPVKHKTITNTTLILPEHSYFFMLSQVYVAQFLTVPHDTSVVLFWEMNEYYPDMEHFKFAKFSCVEKCADT